ncbi:MAG: hypothetical protein ACREUL_17805 [Steroidobacteraceae bacterium]
MATPYDHAFPDALGRLLSNIIQLEFAVRVALHLQEPEEARMSTEILRSIKVGDLLPGTYLTNWMQLEQLIDDYNARERDRGSTPIDEGIVELRHALAHGRLTASTLTSEYSLFRFSRANPQSGAVTVERIDVLTLRWLEEQVGRTGQALNSVFLRIQELKPEAKLRTS